uniref:ATP synthase complex subunit 8 n=1 Tax=Cordulia aenea TaxID=197156 RepID=A0A059PBB2_9ODON|nr:ATP synthase F0 subunit 8 [Cordulia aenea]
MIPQMAPMSWTILFLLFSLMLIMINTLNYYLFSPKISLQESTKKMTISTKSWKW